MITLNPSNVSFNQETHIYTLGTHQLNGITTLLKEVLFPHMYEGINPNILEQAASKGSYIHELIELNDTGFDNCVDSLELGNYKEIKETNNLTTLKNEYIVTDNKHFASPIDVVFTNDKDEIILADIKTTSILQTEYVRWQLSIYAYLFEKQNPHLCVSELRAIWLRNEQYKYKKIERIDNNIIDHLLYCFTTGAPFVNPFAITADNETAPVEISSVELYIAEVQSQIKTLEEQKKKYTEAILKAMQQYDIKSYKGSYISATRKLATTRSSIDSRALQKDHPDIYKKYLKETSIKESILIKVIENDEQ